MKLKSLREWVVIVGVYLVVGYFVVSPVIRTLREHFRTHYPEAYAAHVRLIAVVAPCVFAGLLFFYGRKSSRAFREGMGNGWGGRAER